MTILQRRVAAAQATLDHFKDKPFQWGQCDCASLIAFNLRQLGVVTPLRSFGPYRTALGARRALKAKGFESLAAVLDSIGLPQIGYASALPGDVFSLPGSDNLTALAIYVGNGRVFGFHEAAAGGVVMAPSQIVTAWRSI